MEIMWCWDNVTEVVVADQVSLLYRINLAFHLLQQKQKVVDQCWNKIFFFKQEWNNIFSWRPFWVWRGQANVNNLGNVFVQF